MKKSVTKSLKAATILSVVGLIIFIACFVYAHAFGYSNGKLSSSILVIGGIVILIKNGFAYKRAKAEESNEIFE